MIIIIDTKIYFSKKSLFFEKTVIFCAKMDIIIQKQ